MTYRSDGKYIKQIWHVHQEHIYRWGIELIHHTIDIAVNGTNVYYCWHYSFVCILKMVLKKTDKENTLERTVEAINNG